MQGNRHRHHEEEARFRDRVHSPENRRRPVMGCGELWIAPSQLCCSVDAERSMSGRLLSPTIGGVGRPRVEWGQLKQPCYTYDPASHQVVRPVQISRHDSAHEQVHEEVSIGRTPQSYTPNICIALLQFKKARGRERNGQRNGSMNWIVFHR